MKKHKLGIVGSGALSSIIGEVVVKNLSGDYEILGIFSRSKANTLKLANKLNCKGYKTLNEMIEDRPDYIIEAASPNLVKDMGIEILKNGINLIPLSVGAFADREFYEKMEKKALKNNSRVHIPSGAVGGFDVLQSARLMEDVEVNITTEKSHNSLNGAPYLDGRLLSEEKTEEVFRGSALEAIKLFPENINVAVATALATTGVDNTQVIIKSIPNITSNTHNISLVGEKTKVNIVIESTPSSDNPKSSILAAYSVIALLKNIVSPITF